MSNDTEVVTHAFVNYISPPGLTGEIALITLDNSRDHTRPTTFGPTGLSNVSSALDEIAAHSPSVKAIAITGKPYVFAVGADLTAMPRLSTWQQAQELGQLGHHIFGRFGDSAIPTFAFINGAALGGGLEIALHCHYRTVAANVTALGLPECALGLIPGWGGAFLLPNLIGPQRAITVIVEHALNNNTMLTAPQAMKLGVVDAIFPPADFLEESLRWAVDVINGTISTDRAHIARDAQWDKAVQRGKSFVDSKIHGAAPAPYRALELLADAKTSTKQAAFAAEDNALADLIMSDELRAGLYAFNLVQRRAKRPVGVPDLSSARPITKVGVVGAGLMASQIGLLFARRLNVPVVLTDIDENRLTKGVNYAHQEIAKLQNKGRITVDDMHRLQNLITGSPNKAVFADADLVIEAVFEDMAIKQQVFAELEQAVRDDCLLATNTSSLSISQMAGNLKHPERVVGLHFFNPVAKMPLVEVIRGKDTDDATMATAFSMVKSLKKNGVAVSDAPAFVVNRILTRFLSEVFASVDEGTPIEIAEAALLPLGLPMTPFTLLQLVGPAVAQHVGETLHEAFPERFPVSENLARMVSAGKPGIYLMDDHQPRLDPDIPGLLRQGNSPSNAEQVRDRALRAIAQEIRIMLDEGVVSDVQDIDLCMILGAGWPFHLGGITPYLDRAGISESVTGRRFSPPGIATLPAHDIAAQPV